MGRRERRHKQLLDDLKETVGYWKLKEEALALTPWKTRCGRVWICLKIDCGMTERGQGKLFLRFAYSEIICFFVSEAKDSGK